MTDTPTPNPAGSSPEEPTQQIPPVPPAPPAGSAPEYGGGQPAPVAKPTNTLAIVALVGSFFIGLVGIICGHIALGQIKRSNGQQSGRGLALAGTIIGYVQTAIVIFWIILSVVLLSVAATTVNNASNELQQQLEQLPEVTDPMTEEPTDTPTDEPTTEASGDRSAEFCAALDGVNSASGEVSSGGAVSESALKAFKQLADVESPNQEVYQRFYEVAKDPAAAADDKNLQSLGEDFVAALMEDGIACAG